MPRYEFYFAGALARVKETSAERFQQVDEDLRVTRLISSYRQAHPVSRSY